MFSSKVIVLYYYNCFYFIIKNHESQKSYFYLKNYNKLNK